jgi:hypothetical protein
LIDGLASITLGLSGDLTADSSVIFGIGNGGATTNTISSDATITVNAANISGLNITCNIFNSAGFTDTDPQTIVGTGGTILGKAAISLTLSGDLTASQNEISIGIDNFVQGSIGLDATVAVQAATVFATGPGGSFFEYIDNSNAGTEPTGGSIGGNAAVTLTLSGDLNTEFGANFNIFNGSGTIGGNATITVAAADLQVGSLTANIDNTTGTIGGNATVTLNVSGDATINGDANVQIIGNDPAGSAAININGGNYDVGGTFRSTIDGNGTLTFNNANINADVIKAGVFGSNGTLIVGGGNLSANTELKLYAPGSNGKIEFNANVSLNGGSTAAIIAANTVTIDNGVTVTIGGSIAAQVYANNRNYVGGGTGSSSTGTFDGAGVVNNSFGGQPTFGSANGISSSTSSAAPTRIATVGQIRVNNSGQLLSMANAASGDAAGRTAARTSNRTNRSQNSRRVNSNANRTVTESRSDARNTLTNSSALKLQ